LLHLGIPTLGLVAEVDAGLQQFLHCDRRQINLLLHVRGKTFTGREAIPAGENNILNV
jgi:hypothetical protein